MEDTRRKAEEMIRFKTEKEEYYRRRMTAEQNKISRAKELISMTNESKMQMRLSMAEW